MKTETMNVHKALCELKVLDKRIEKKLDGATFATTCKHSDETVLGKTKTDCEASMNDEYTSILDLITRRKAIRKALALSNASTYVTIGTVKYAVSEAIEMKKNGIVIDKELLDELVRQYNAAKQKQLVKNEDLQKQADSYVIGLFGDKEKANTRDAENVREAYVTQNQTEILSTTSIEDSIKNLSKFIDTFEAEFDSAISVSNALTEITITY